MNLLKQQNLFRASNSNLNSQQQSLMGGFNQSMDEPLNKFCSNLSNDLHQHNNSQLPYASTTGLNNSLQRNMGFFSGYEQVR